MEQTPIFRSNRSQAVRLPKAVAFPADVKRVDIVAIGRARIVTPAGEIWDTWFDDLRADYEFMIRREQPMDQERQAF